MNTKLSLKARSTVIQILNRSEEPLNSMQVKRLVEIEIRDERYDWHEYLNYLEVLTGRGIAKYAGLSNDGRQQYKIADW